MFIFLCSLNYLLFILYIGTEVAQGNSFGECDDVLINLLEELDHNSVFFLSGFFNYLSETFTVSKANKSRVHDVWGVAKPNGSNDWIFEERSQVFVVRPICKHVI